MPYKQIGNNDAEANKRDGESEYASLSGHGTGGIMITVASAHKKTLQS